MNSAVLLVVAVIVFGMGYRFYAKFLTLGVFRLDSNAPTPASHRHDAFEFLPANRGVLLGHHIAGTTGLVTIIGVSIATAWGWVPAFLCLVVGALIAGGTYALGSLWVSLRYTGDTAPRVARELLGPAGTIPLYLLALILLFGLTALFALLMGRLLAAQPSAVWAFALLALATAAVRRALAAPSLGLRLGHIGMALAWIAVGLALGQRLPVALEGNWILALADDPFVTVSEELVWGLLALMFAAFTLRMPVSTIARPRGLLASFLLVLTVSLVIAGILVSHPDLSAPQFHHDPQSPNIFALLLLVLTGGALAGFHALIITGPTGRQLARQREAPSVAYGGALVDGLVGVLVLITLTASLAGLEDWQAMYPTWPELVSIHLWINVFIERSGHFIAVLGVPQSWSVGLTALTVAALALSGMETLLRTLGFVIAELGDSLNLRLLTTKTYRERLTLFAIVGAVIGLSQIEMSVDHWLILGLANQHFAIGVLLVIMLALLRISRPILLVAIPLAIVGGGTLLGSTTLLVGWWRDTHWPLFIMGAVAALLGLWVAVSAARAALDIQRRKNAGMLLQTTHLYSRYIPPNKS